MSEKSKPSVYLLERVKVFEQTVSFFEDTNEKRMIFLAQIDFWDWEMDTLIYTLESFKERSKAWTEDIEPLLLKKGILTKHKMLEKVQWNNSWRGGKNKVVAPVEELNRLIDHWNDFMTMLEKKCFRDDSEEMARLNSAFVGNLSKYRKKKL